MKINESLQLVLEFIPTPIQNLKVIFDWLDITLYWIRYKILYYILYLDSDKIR